MRSFIDHIKNNPVKYFSLLVLSFSVALGTNTIATSLKEYEKISIFLASYTTDTTAFNQAVEDSTPEYIKEMSLYSFSLKDQSFDYYYSTIALARCDIVIIPESVIEDDTILKTFKKIPEIIENEYFNDASFYSIYENHYGLKIHSEGQNKPNSPITYVGDDSQDQNYYVFFNSNSIHVSNRYNTVYKIIRGVLHVL